MSNYNYLIMDVTGGEDLDIDERAQIPVRSLKADDIDELVKIDKRATGQDRREYYERKVKEA